MPVVLSSSPAAAQPKTGEAAAAPPEKLPAEEIRFHTGVFRAALEKRGLKELLDLHLADYPPADAVERKLMTREIKLAEFADEDRPLDERRTAITAANRILEELIDQHPDDPRRLDWRFTLAHSLLYDEGEPFANSLLYREGGPDARRELGALAPRAVEVTEALRSEIKDAFDRVDALPVAEFEALERTGYIEKLDRLAPKARYLHLWALYFDALWRAPDDLKRVEHLHEIVRILAQRPEFIETPHEQSGVQVQSLLLIGTTNRLLDRHADARDHLDRAVRVAERLTDPARRDRIQWALTLAHLERIRTDRDDGRLNEALAGIERFRETVPPAAAESRRLELDLTAALLERSIYSARADQAEKDGRAAEAAQLRNLAWQSVARLVAANPQRRDRIFHAVHDLIEPPQTVAQLDPLEQTATVHQLVATAGENGRSKPALQRAIEIGEHFLSRPNDAAAELVPQVLFDLGTAHYRTGHTAEAAQRYLEVASQHPRFDRADEAAALAVQLAAKRRQEGSKRPQNATNLYRNALETLISGYSDTPSGRYWRFFYAELLENSREFDAAAAQFALISPDHEHYLPSQFFRIRALAHALRERAESGRGESDELKRRAADLFSLERRFFVQATDALSKNPPPDRRQMLKEFLARARLLLAETQVLPAIGNPQQALDTLAGIEAQTADRAALAGRIWKVRLLAYEQSDRIDEAAEAVPRFVAADPANAGPTLQSLYRDITEDVERLRRIGNDEKAERKARVALLLAEQLYEWAVRHSDQSLETQHALLIQWAEAHLPAGKYEQALALIEPLLPESLESGPLSPAEIRAAYIYAEALYHVDEFDRALPVFNRLARALPARSATRWQALVRDLDCRTRLNHPPQDIIKVIEQQRFLHPELGGPETAEQLDKLLRENQRRLEGD